MYTKPVKSISELIEKLRKKGFVITSDQEVKAKEFLQNRGYYHTSSYMKSFFSPGRKKDKVKKEGLSFDNVIELYGCDRNLQSFLFWLLLHIEVFLKARFIHLSCEKYGSPFWYLDQNNLFTNCDTLIANIISDNQKSHILKNYQQKHGENEPFPLWHLVEVSSFGPFCDFFSHTTKELNAEFYKIFNFGENVYFTQFKGWLHGLCRLRNRVAHSEISWSMRLLPEIKLPHINTPLNSITAYVCLIYVFLKAEDKNFANIFFFNLLESLKNISKVEGITFPEKQRIGINGNREEVILMRKSKIDGH